MPLAEAAVPEKFVLSADRARILSARRNVSLPLAQRLLASLRRWIYGNRAELNTAKDGTCCWSFHRQSDHRNGLSLFFCERYMYRKHPAGAA